MKWIGALLFLSISTWFGLEWSNKLNKRPTEIRQFKSSLQILESEMMYSQLPLKAAFYAISSQTSEPTRSFFENMADGLNETNQTFVQLWDDQLDCFIQETALGKNEQEILKQFGRTLGQHNFEQQQKHIKLTAIHLERELEEARDNQKRYSKMAKSLGFLCGLFIILLLI